MTGARLGAGGEVTADDFAVLALDGTEALSEPFAFRLELRPNGSTAPSALLGKRLVVELLGADEPRPIAGTVTSVRRLVDGRIEAELRPWFALLDLHLDARIFQDMSAPGVLEQALTPFAFATFRNDTLASYRTLDYCVQYDETTRAFLSRLLEAEGIGYRSTADDDADTLVLFDDVSTLPEHPGDGIPFLELPPNADWLDDERIATLETLDRIGAACWSSTDYAPDTPDLPLDVSLGEGDLEAFEHPGRYATRDDGERTVRLRREADELDRREISGTSPIRQLRPGLRFALVDHPTAGIDGRYVVRRVHHDLQRGTYRNRFEAFPETVTYRPERRTRRPRILGPQTAQVVGPEGEEIHCDEQGRIKVRFHWDRGDAEDKDASCYVRVAQALAGGGFGAFVLPRVGQEVVVSFLDGDPDRPLVTGTVYNGSNAPPLALPDANTKTAFVSRSTPDGEDGNRLVIEDKAGEEVIEVYASRDLTVEVEADHSLTVNTGNRTIAVAEGDETHDVEGKRSLSVTGAETHTNSDTFTHQVGGAYSLKADGDVTIEAGGTLTLKTAGGSIVIDSTGNVTVSANMDVKLEGKVNAELKAGAQLTVKGTAMGTVDGGGMLTIKGGMVMIN